MLFVAVSLLVPSEQCRISLAFYSKASGQCTAYDSTIQTCNGQFTTDVSSVCLMDGPISNITDTVNSYIVGGSKGLGSACVKAATEFYCAWFIPQCATDNSSLPICLEQCTTFFVLCSLIPIEQATQVYITRAYCTFNTNHKYIYHMISQICYGVGVPVYNGTSGKTCTGIATTTTSTTTAIATATTDATTATAATTATYTSHGNKLVPSMFLWLSTMF